MDRRTILKTLGIAGAGSAVVTGTGAFTSVEANRDLTVQVASDENALLVIDDTGNDNAEYVVEDSGEFGIDVTGSNKTNAGGSGVNANAITVFENLFRVENQGTQEVNVTVPPVTFVDGGGQTLAVVIVPMTTSSPGNLPAVSLGVGNSETYSVIVTDISTSPTTTDTIEIEAVAP
jgi:hypothetical protein